MSLEDKELLEALAKKAGVGTIKRHMFLCVGEKCCTAEEGNKTWELLKEHCRADDAKAAGVFRTRVGCLRICRGGPIAVVYPEGVWYGAVSPEVCSRIVEEHMIHGKPVEEFVIAKNPLPE